MILKVARLGHPVLREIAEPIPEAEIGSADVQRLIDDMIETMYDQAGVGLAAPQVHVSRRILVLEAEGGHPRYPDAPGVPLQILINHEILEASEEMDEDWEGCLSLPDIRGKVPRHKTIRVRAFDREGKRVEFEASDFHARIIQHEGDHLDGKVFVDRMTDMQSLVFLSEFSRFAEEEREAVESAD